MLEDNNKYDNSKYLVKRLFSGHLRKHLPKLVIAIICMFIVASTTASQAYIMQHIIDDIFLNKNIQMLTIISVAVLIIFCLKGFAIFGQNFIMQTIGQRVITDMQMQLFKHLLSLDFKQVTQESSGKIISRFTNDINTLRTSITIILTGVARELLTMIFLVGVMFYQSWQLSLIVFVVFPVAIYPVIRLGKRMRKISNQTQMSMGDFTERLDETFRSSVVIKAYGQEKYEITRASKAVENIYNLFVKAARNQSAASPIIETVGGIAIASVIFYGGMQVIEGGTSSGKFFSFITAALLAYKPAKTLSSMNTNLQNGLAAAKRLFLLLDQKPLILDKENSLHLANEYKGFKIEFNNVEFSYNDQERALKGVSLIANPSETIALVGNSGGGKSTIMSLILRLYDIDNGSLKVNDIDIKDISIKSLRQNISYVSQNTNLFNDTIFANIAYGNEDVTLVQVAEAAKLAYAHDFIMKLPQGYDTIIGQDGSKLSGGQKQRISIARAILRNAPILLLDEATSALDKISENKIQLALKELVKGKTTIVIAHRLSTIENADRIYVFSHGEIIDSGTHESLIESSNEYRGLSGTI